MANLYLVRHGQASFGADNYDALSDIGWEQCRHLGVWWREHGRLPANVLSGPMVRHQQSAEAFYEGFLLAHEVTILDGLAEFDHENVLTVYRPEFVDKMTMMQALARYPHPLKAFYQLFTEAVNRWHDGRFDAEYSESWPAFKHRVHKAFDQLRLEGKDALVFTSGGVISVIVQQILALSDASCLSITATIHNSSVTRILYRPNETSLHSLNNTAHLDVLNDAALLTYR
jgi:broad specificity phosphatase PhoE